MSKAPNDRYKHADQLGHILQEARERSRHSARQTAVGRSAPPTLVGQQPARQGARAPLRGADAYPAQAAPAPVPPPRRAAPRTAQPKVASPLSPAHSQPLPAQANRLLNADGTINVEATGGYTGPFVPKRQAAREGADVVTIILVILAFLAVAGLAPLYLLGVFPLL